jgi:hypothetical protein
VVAGTDAAGGQVVGQAIGLVLELGVGEPTIAADQRDPLGESVDSSSNKSAMFSAMGRN